jgi:hypothetical protein
MMSSATSTSGDVRLTPDATDVRLEPDTTGSGSVRLQADRTPAFRPAHFFVLASLMAATGAVIMSRQSTPAHLVLISITIASAGLAAAGFYRMMSPLVGDASAIAGEALSERGRAVLAREKALVLRALKDLEFDRSMGKVSQADFEEMAARLRTRALSLMKQLDEDGTGYRTIIERELSARLAARLAAGRLVDQSVESERAPVSIIAGLCSCGTANDADALFCKRCGTKLSGAGATSTPR